MKKEDISSFDLVFLHGNSFIGPPVLPAKSTKELSSSLQHFGGWIDVRDIALAHVLAAQKPEAGGERILISAGDFVWQDLHDLAHTIDPTLPAGDPKAEKNYFMRYNNEKMKRILGLQPRSLEETMRDSLAYYKTVPDKTFSAAM
ncbi:unnamed protein product [Peniophora sp. CBMAI 1063]|nr:unnamed protein product [Peniophora sp. CBMAI 1063]